MPLTILDGIVLAVVIVSAVLAMVRGFVREVLSVASWVAAAAAAYVFHQPFVPLVKPYIESNTAATIVAAAVIFFVALIIASYVTMKVSDFVIDSRIGFLDRMLGLIFGAARGVLIMSVAFLFFTWLVQTPPTWVARAETRPLLQSVGDRLRAVLPADIEAQLLRRIRGNGDAVEETPDNKDKTGAVDPGTGRGNSSTERRAMDTLIESSGAAKR